MIQCILCEDWFHGRHLTKGPGTDIPSDDSYSEMICQLCNEKFHDSFLFAYKGYSVSKLTKDEDSKVDVTKEEEVAVKKEEVAAKESVVKSDEDCILKKNISLKNGEKLALFMVADWRKELCQCKECAKLYLELDVQFLTSEEDTVHHYEDKAKNSGNFAYFLYRASFFFLQNCNFINFRRDL